MIEIGSKYNRLTVINISQHRPRSVKENYYTCLCDCGNLCNVLGSRINNGETKSCGCYRKEIAKEKAKGQKDKPNIKNRKKPYMWLYNVLKKSAIKRFGVCQITYDDYVSLIKNTKCHYCGTVVILPQPHKTQDGPENYSLDRKDNSRGYELDNVVVSCFPCNESKSNLYTYDEWKIMTEALQRHRAKKHD